MLHMCLEGFEDGLEFLVARQDWFQQADLASVEREYVVALVVEL